MKFSTLIALVGVANASLSLQDLTPETVQGLPPIPKLPVDPLDVKYFIDGMIQVFVQKDDFKEIDACFKDTTTIESQLSQAIELIMKKDIPDILAAVKIIGEILQEIPDQLGDCKGMEDDVARIEKWADIFKHPFTLIPKLIKNTAANIDKIAADIDDIVEQIEHHSATPKDHLFMKAIGEDIAKILVLQLGPVPKAKEGLPPIPKLPFSPLDIKMFVDGMLQVLIHKNDFKEIDVCFKDTTHIESLLAEAVEDFEMKDMDHIMAAIKVVGEIVQDIPDQLKDCEGMQADMARIEKWADIFKHPWVLIPKATKNTIAHFPEILGLTSDLVNMATKNHTQFPASMRNAGRDQAKILVLQLGPVPKMIEADNYIMGPEDLEIVQW